MNRQPPIDVGNVSVYAGDDTLLLAVSFYDDNDVPDPMPGYTWRAMWRLTRESPDHIPLTAFKNGNELTVSVSAADTLVMDCMGGVWDVEATSTQGIVTTFFKGTTTWEGDVTR